jgi:hypothetical protein
MNTIIGGGNSSSQSAKQTYSKQFLGQASGSQAVHLTQANGQASALEAKSFKTGKDCCNGVCSAVLGGKAIGTNQMSATTRIAINTFVG